MQLYLTTLTATALLSLSHFTSALTIPAVSSSLDAQQLASRADAKAEQVRVRMMPLGASIVAGYQSKPQNGFRKPLRDMLTTGEKKWDVDFVGSLQNGDFKDNSHEGHIGMRIDEIALFLGNSTARDSKPNVYLVNAGTNDCQQNFKKMQGTVDRLGDLLEQAWKQSPTATIVLSTVLASFNEKGNPGAAKRVEELNKGVRELAKTLQSQSKRLLLAEMSDGKVLTKSDMNADGIHPTNDGYKKMAEVWAKSLQEAYQMGMLLKPE